MEDPTGYQHPAYAHSLSEFGTPHRLPASEGWILERGIPGSTDRDGMGCYPLFTCRDWRKLHIDMTGLAKDLLTLVLVTDPFADVDRAYLEGCFDLVKPFKCHSIVDLSQPLEKSVNKHHRYYTRKSLREIEVEVCHEPSRYAGEWIRLYAHLVQKHGISGIRAFSPECFHKQLNTPGMVLFVGTRRGEVVGAHWIAIQGDVAYSHLAAFSTVGYQTHAAYGIYWMTLEYLASHKVRYCDLGAAAGLGEKSTGGLGRFKQGWSEVTRMAYLCGRIFDFPKYTETCRRNRIGSTDYFPAYRVGEFN
jgi:hypothetical protein